MSLGGNGYVEESVLPRIYRETPVNSIWEGSGNVNALDVLRALRKQPEVFEAFLAELEPARGADARFDAALRSLDTGAGEAGARRLVERMALLLQAALLLRHAPPPVADAFCASRLGGEGGASFGTLPHGTDTAGIVERAWPS